MEPLIAEWKLYETAEDETRMEPLNKSATRDQVFLQNIFRQSCAP